MAALKLNRKLERYGGLLRAEYSILKILYGRNAPVAVQSGFKTGAD